jgi:HAD superfamily hydrolase (TIGR01484 family)
LKQSDPLPIDSLPEQSCRKLRYLFSDLDDTITSDGLLPPESYTALWRLHRAGVGVIVVTGRPAGWCDHFARMWPLLAVVGENGAFYFSYDRQAKKMERSYLLSERDRVEGRRRLERVRDRVLSEVPGSGIAADQPFRLADLAIDFCEDVPPLPREQVRRIAEIAREEGAVAKISSIHVNCWYGEFDKVSCVRYFLENKASLSWSEALECVLFVGDSPNDEPMFREVEHSVGVANLRDYLDDMECLPRYLTDGRGAAGFCELASLIVSRRSGPVVAVSEM